MTTIVLRDGTTVDSIEGFVEAYCAFKGRSMPAFLCPLIKAGTPDSTISAAAEITATTSGCYSKFINPTGNDYDDQLVNALLTLVDAALD